MGGTLGRCGFSSVGNIDERCRRSLGIPVMFSL